MRAFLINLSRRPDRLRAMIRQLELLGIRFERVAAVDARQISDAAVNAHFCTKGPLGKIAKGDKCCTLSHRRAWEALVRSGDGFGLILEDDVHLDRQAVQLLRSEDWIPKAVGLLKLEQYVACGKRILVGEPVAAPCGHQIAPLRSKHTGAAAYIISRETAMLLLSRISKWPLPVDHMLFNPNNSPMIEALNPYQMVPAIARQSADIGGRTDIEEWRRGLRDFGLSMLRRELRHAYYELRLLPLQVLSVLRRDSRVVRFGRGREFEPA